MEITKTIKVPNEIVFGRIISSCLFDIEKQTGKRLEVGGLSKFEYTKRFRQNQTGRIKFDEVTEPTVYAFSTYTNRNSFHTRWEMREADQETTEVKVSESQESNGFFQSLNDKVLAIFLGRAKRKQILAILNDIENTYGNKK
jgi:hypothetical protein